MRVETEDVLYQATTTIAVALGYSEDHISIPLTKYGFLEDVASMLERQNALPSVIDVLLISTAQRQDFYTIHDYVHAILHLVSTEVISQYKASEDPPVKVEAAEPTRLASERMPAPGQPHREPAQQERFQDPELPKFGWPTGPYLSVHAGTSSPDMNKHSHPSATEECVTSWDRNAPPGSIHHHPHQAPEQQVPGETDKSSAHQSAAEVTRLAMEAMRMQTETFA